MEFVEKCNQDTTTHIVLELVDKGLTPIIQVPGVAINKVFKSAVKKIYHQHRTKLPIIMGEKLLILWEQLVDFVLEAIEEINEQNNEHQFISDSFKKCGLNPWSKDNSMKAFTDHLDSLESNEILRAMLANQRALPLGD
jgi:hypothetical protein